ncbi:MAG: hypothetical protein MRERV_35c036 [Mycoplasmataceae bacterium RV_VA103A]|nr:MAG: hypothetical protein MRERV_35c036 [Mycoplasmataceae bacterium RV_VA103A]
MSHNRFPHFASKICDFLAIGQFCQIFLSTFFVSSQTFV